MPSNKADPLPPGLIELAVQFCRASATAHDHWCIADMITIGRFFFLCLPGEHTMITFDNEPFKQLSNVNFYLLDQPGSASHRTHPFSNSLTS